MFKDIQVNVTTVQEKFSENCFSHVSNSSEDAGMLA
jgi:hypothetical protein